jgi:hypothetical protein
MNDSIEVYITSDYSVVLDKDDIKAITECVREALYEMPRPTDYSVADILSTVNLYVNTQMEINMTCDTKETYCYGDLDNKQRTKSDYWQVMKEILTQIKVIAK